MFVEILTSMTAVVDKISDKIPSPTVVQRSVRKIFSQGVESSKQVWLLVFQWCVDTCALSLVR